MENITWEIQRNSISSWHLFWKLKPTSDLLKDMSCDTCDHAPFANSDVLDKLKGLRNFRKQASKDRLKILKKSLDIQNQAVHFNTRQANVTWRMSSDSLGVNMKSWFLVVSAWERIRILHLEDRPIW